MFCLEYLSMRRIDSSHTPAGTYTIRLWDFHLECGHTVYAAFSNLVTAAHIAIT